MYTLPDGKTTEDADEYVAKWRQLFEGSEKILGGEVYAFNPHVSLSLGVHTLQIRPHTAERLAKLWGILNRLISESPTYFSDFNDEWICTYCENSPNGTHQENCPWRQLKEFMEQ